MGEEFGSSLAWSSAWDSTWLQSCSWLGYILFLSSGLPCKLGLLFRQKCTVINSARWKTAFPCSFSGWFYSWMLPLRHFPKTAFPIPQKEKCLVISRGKISCEPLQWLSQGLLQHAGTTAMPSPTSYGALLQVLCHSLWSSGWFLYLLFLYSLESSLLLSNQSLILQCPVIVNNSFN